MRTFRPRRDTEITLRGMDWEARIMRNLASRERILALEARRKAREAKEASRTQQISVVVEVEAETRGCEDEDA